MSQETGDLCRTAQFAVTRILADAPGSSELVPRLLQAICESLGWEWSALWTPAPRENLLRCRATWHGAHARFAEFEQVSRSTAFAPGVGLPGRVWSSGQPAWIVDVVKDSNFPRAPWAEKAGLHGSFAFPIRLGGEILGIMEFFSREIRPPQEDLLDTFSTVGAQIGQVLQRRRAEEELQMLSAALQNAVEGISRIDPEGRYVSVNQACADMFGWKPQEMTGVDWRVTVHPDDRPRVAEALRRLAAEGRQVLEVRGVKRDGTSFHVQRTLVKALDPDGREAGFYCFTRDISERKRQDESRVQELTLLNQMVQTLHACLTVEEAYGVVRQFITQLFPGDAGAFFVLNPSRNFIEPVAQWGDVPAVADGEIFAADDCWGLRRGQPYTIDKTSGAPVCRHVAPGAPCGSVCVPMVAQGEALGMVHFRARDAGQPLTEAARRLAMTVSEQCAMALANLKLRETLRNQSVRDALTGLFNRRYLEETLDRELWRATRKSGTLGLLMIDVDHFKQFNDTHGHEAGDAILREIGTLLKAAVRAADVAARYGGEEFTLLFPDAPLEDCVVRAEEIRARAQRLSVTLQGKVIGPVTISVGVASSPRHGTAADGLLKAADEALYRAKDLGRNRVVTAP